MAAWNNINTELSGKTPAFISWIQVIGLFVFISSRLFFRQTSWLLFAAFSLVFAAHLINMYFDWKHGRNKSFRYRLIVLLMGIVFGLIVGYIAGTKE